MAPSPSAPATISRGPEHDVFFLGRNLSEFPCFRSSFLTGIFTGVAGGLGYFMYSSKPAHSSHAAVGTFIVTTVCYWTVCRYQYYRAKVELLEADEIRQQNKKIKLLNVEERKKELEELSKGSS